MNRRSENHILGDFEISGELGRGGMGIVYDARQRSLNRRVALKVLPMSLGMTTRAVVRFRREAEAAAKLHHTNIVPIYATGEHDGTHFYAMELIDGPSLNLVIGAMRVQAPGLESTPAPHVGEATRTHVSAADPVEPCAESASALPDWVMPALSAGSSLGSGSGEGSATFAQATNYVDTVARLIAEVADALDYAHSHGVVHRDIKPSNLLLAPEGRLSINDFGLARMLEQPGMTMTGEFVGSPLYMSPEQIAAGRAALDHRTDIYSLGATLYELLTLQPPFPGERRDQIIGQILHKEPVPLRRINKRIPVDLETICLKAMEKDPDRRYQTAGELAEDLRRFVNRFAISAKRAGVIGRTAKWVRRHPSVAALGLAVCLIGIAAGGLAWRSQLAGQRIVELELAAAKEDALLHAMSGKFEQAEDYIKNAEAAGASAGWVRLLRAQVAYYRGEAEAALEHSRQAVRLMPDSVAANGLLCMTLVAVEGPDSLYAMHEKLLDMQPESFEDYLLKGLGETWLSPRRAVADLDHAIDLQPASPVARVIRAEALRSLAMHTGELRHAERAVEDAAAATSFLPGNALALACHLETQVVRANLLREAGRDAEADAAVARGAELETRLRHFPKDANAVWARVNFYRMTGQDDAAHDTMCSGSQILMWSQSYMAACCANGWFDRYEPDKALAAFYDARGPEGQLLWLIPVFLQMEQVDDRKALLDEILANHTTRASSSGFFEILDWATLRLLGDETRAAAIGAQWAKYNVPGDFSAQWDALAEYIAGGSTVEETVRRTAGARFPQSYAHYAIAIDLLARGDRDAARYHFKASVDLNFFNLFSHYWSQSFLKRLEADPTWPPWIPMAADGTETGEATRRPHGA